MKHCSEEEMRNKNYALATNALDALSASVICIEISNL